MKSNLCQRLSLAVKWFLKSKSFRRGAIFLQTAQFLLCFLDRWDMTLPDPPEHDLVLSNLLEPLFPAAQEISMHRLVDEILKRVSENLSKQEWLGKLVG